MSYKSGDEVVGLLPCAGIGSRLGAPFAKELLPFPVNGRLKAVCEFSIQQELGAGADSFVVITRRNKPELRRYLEYLPAIRSSVTFRFQTRFVQEGSSPGLLQAIAVGCRGLNTQSVLMALPDTIITPLDSLRLVRESLRPGWDLAMGVFPTATPELFAPVVYERTGLVVEVLDKPAKSPVSNTWGCFAWTPRFTRFLQEFCRRNPVGDFRTCLAQALAGGLCAKATYFEYGSFVDFGTVESWAQYIRRPHTP